MAGGTAYSKRYAGGFHDKPTQDSPIDQQFLNAVETALLQLIGAAPNADGQVMQWDNANTRYGPALLLNKNIDPAAAIAKSKIDFTGANGIVDADIAGAAAIAQSKINGLTASLAALLPPGVIAPYGAAAAPTGWVLCDGASYLRADGTHDALFAVIGTTYGSADGTHFNVPDLVGRVAVGYAAAGGHTDVSTLGNNDGVAKANRRAKHRHTVTDPGHSHSSRIFHTTAVAGSGTDGTQPGSTGSATTGISVGPGGTTDALDAPAYLVLNYIIKL